MGRAPAMQGRRTRCAPAHRRRPGRARPPVRPRRPRSPRRGARRGSCSGTPRCRRRPAARVRAGCSDVDFLWCLRTDMQPPRASLSCGLTPSASHSRCCCDNCPRTMLLASAVAQATWAAAETLTCGSQRLGRAPGMPGAAAAAPRPASAPARPPPRVPRPAQRRAVSRMRSQGRSCACVPAAHAACAVCE